jgi:hypothetical protein
MMILAESLGDQFTISNGKIVSADPFYEDLFDAISDPVPGPSEGDPDMVYFKRMKSALMVASIIKYTPMTIDETVSY